MRRLATLLTAALALGAGAEALAHCEIPCGIYGDQLRIHALREDVTTIEKSMQQIEELSKAKQPNYNQLVRWVTNKEAHAEKIQQQVAQYWLHQRIKPATDKAGHAAYLRQLEILHGISVNAMKAKQTTDLEFVKALRGLIDELVKAYFSAEDQKHLKGH